MGSYFAFLLLFFLSHGAEDRKGLWEAFLQAESRFAEEQQEQQQHKLGLLSPGVSQGLRVISYTVLGSHGCVM